MAARIKLGELLVRAGVLDDLKLKAALVEQQRWGGRLGKILVDMNFVPEEMLIRALSKQLGIPRATFTPPPVIPPDLLAKITSQFCSNHGVCPERYLADKKTLVLAMVDPTNVSALDELRFKTGMRLETSLAGELEVVRAIERLYFNRAPVDGLDLGTSTSVGPDAQYRAVMAASGVSTDDVEPVSSQDLAPRPTPRSQDLPEPQRRSQDLPPPSPLSQRPGPPPLPAPAQRTPSTAALEMAVTIEAAQKRQQKALRVMLELLVEKGVFSRDEYLQLVGRR